MSRSENRHHRGFGVYFLALAGVLLFSCGSYFLFVRAFMPDYPVSQAASIALGLVVVVGGLIRAAGTVSARSRHQEESKSEAGGSSEKLVAAAKVIPLFLLLWCVSGAGIFGTLALFSGGPAMIRASAEGATDTLALLKSRTAAGLKVAEYEALTARVRNLEVQLRNEIFSPVPGFCGVGPRGGLVIKRIEAEIGGFPEISGTGQRIPCSNVEALEKIAATYGTAINAGLMNHALVVKYDIPRRRELEGRIEALVAEGAKDITAITTSLAGVSNFVMKPELYTESIKSLQSLSDRYRMLRQQLVAFAPGEDKNLPKVIELGAAKDLMGGVASIFLIAAELPWYKMLLFLLFPLGLDILIVRSTAAAIGRRDDLEKRLQLATQAVQFLGTSVKYILPEQ